MKVTYIYQVRYNGASAVLVHADGSESFIGDETFKLALRYEYVSAKYMTPLVYDNIKLVCDYLMEEGGKEYSERLGEFAGDEDVLFEKAYAIHTNLFGSEGLKARFLVGHDS